MTDQPELTSADAVEVAAFCWPEEVWEAIPNADGSAQSHIVHANEKTEPCSFFFVDDFNDLHRAFAMLMKLGHEQRLGVHLSQQTGTDNGRTTHYQKLSRAAAAPAAAWARAILVTVREVKNRKAWPEDKE